MLSFKNFPTRPAHPTVVGAAVAAMVAALVVMWPWYVGGAALVALALAWFLPPRAKWNETVNQISDNTYNFSDPLRDVYDVVFPTHTAEYGTLDLLVHAADWPPYDPSTVPRLWDGYKNLKGADALLWEFVQRVYPEPQPGKGGLGRRSELPDDKFEAFDSARKALKRVFNHVGQCHQACVTGYRKFLKEEISPYRDRVKLVAYLDLALARTESGASVNKAPGIKSLWGLADGYWPT